MSTKGYKVTDGNLSCRGFNYVLNNLTPDIYRVTLVSGKDTINMKTSSLYTVGYNTCTGYDLDVPHNLIP
jgi:hypothetical protein